MTKHAQMGVFWSVWWSKGPSACVEHKTYPSGYFFVFSASRGCGGGGGGVEGEPLFDGLRVGKAPNTKIVPVWVRFWCSMQAEWWWGCRKTRNM